MIYRNEPSGFIDRFCARHPRIGVPNLMLYVAIAQVAVFVLDLFSRGAASALLSFDRAAIFSGQIWRLLTFAVLPRSANPFFLLLSCYFYYWIGLMLEREWGSAKFTLFYLSGIVLTVISGLILNWANMYYVNLSIFLVIATLYGEMRVLLFFVVPVKMKWMAFIDVALILVDVVQYAQMGIWTLALAPVASFVNYFVFTWPYWSLRLGLRRHQFDPKVIDFKRAARDAQRKNQSAPYTHKCAVCGITDADDPNMEFRYCSKCDGYYCYCMNHINNHVHIRQ